MPEKYKPLSFESYHDMSNTTYPRGLFWAMGSDCFIGIDNRNGSMVEKKFDDLRECSAWLRGRLRDE